jgi:hypothetical protein
LEQSIVYVDIENLQDVAKQTITNAIKNWPADFPQPCSIKFYVKADQTELWKIWASHNIPNVEIIVKGVQHYTFNGSKNSADILLALDALSDLLKSKTKHIAVMSDDSDYVSLFTAIKQEIGITENPRSLFKWIMTNRPDTRSQVLNDFFPEEYIYIVNCSSTRIHEKDVKKESIEREPLKISLSEQEQMAKSIIQNIPIGPFKSSDCKKLIVKNFPKHPLGKASSAVFGTQFANGIWPLLEKYGVQLPNPNRKPRKYEMTQEAKDKGG